MVQPVEKPSFAKKLPDLIESKTMLDLKPPSVFVVEKPAPQKPVRKTIPRVIEREPVFSRDIIPSLATEIAKINHHVHLQLGRYTSIIRRLAPAIFHVELGWKELQYPRITSREKYIMPDSRIEMEKHTTKIPQLWNTINLPRDDFIRMTARQQRPLLLLSRMVQLFSAKEDEVGFRMLKDNGTNLEATFMEVMNLFSETGLWHGHPVDVVMDTKTYNKYRNDFIPYRDSKLNILKNRAGGEVFPLRTDENIVYFLPRSSGYDNAWCIYSSGIETNVWEKPSWDISISMRESFTVPVLRPNGVIYMTEPENTSNLLMEI
jgi:hypothetical protein